MTKKYNVGAGDQLPHNRKLINIFLQLYSIKYFGLVVKPILRWYFRLPKNTDFIPGFYCNAPNLIIGNNVGLGDTFIIAYDTVTIGDNSSFSYGNKIITSSHDYQNFGIVETKPIIIGSNVWITTNVTILPGVTIGNNTVIGAGSVVTKDIPSGVFAAGNPCKPIKEIRFRIK